MSYKWNKESWNVSNKKEFYCHVLKLQQINTTTIYFIRDFAEANEDSWTLNGVKWNYNRATYKSMQRLIVPKYNILRQLYKWQ